VINQISKTIMRIFFIILLNIINGVVVFGQSSTSNSNSATSLDSEFRYGQLKNGFRYYIKHIETDNSKVLMNLYIRAGQEQEDKDQYHLAHFLEHMAAGYTKNFTHLYHNAKLLNP